MMSSASVSKKQIIFFGYFDPNDVFCYHKNKSFQGALTNISTLQKNTGDEDNTGE